jgi:DNA-binding transcriptional ArsR family regulator
MVGHRQERLDEVFHALSNGTRRQIVSLLAMRPYYVGELVPHFDMSLAAVSKHVTSLERAGLIKREIVGRNHICRFNAEALSEAFEWMGEYESFWRDRLDALETVLSREKSARNGKQKQK